MSMCAFDLSVLPSPHVSLSLSPSRSLLRDSCIALFPPWQLQASARIQECFLRATGLRDDVTVTPLSIPYQGTYLSGSVSSKGTFFHCISSLGIHILISLGIGLPPECSVLGCLSAWVGVVNEFGNILSSYIECSLDYLSLSSLSLSLSHT